MGRVNLYFIFVVLVIACGGIPKGYDEGGFSASITLKSYQKDFNLLKDNWKNDKSGLANRNANITSFGVLGAAFGALSAVYFDDRLGRLRTWQLAVVVWACGLLVQIFSSGIYGLLLFARIFTGLGAGACTAAAPLYLNEIAPPRIRGGVTTMYMVNVLFYLALGFFINYACNKTLEPSRMQYRLVQAIPMIPVGIAFCLSMFLTDTPRWLASKDRREESQRALARLRGLSVEDPRLLEEMGDIEGSIRAKAADLAHTNMAKMFKELVTVPSYRKRYLLVIAFHTVAQWSGGNAITFYVTQIFSAAGISSQGTTLVSGGAYGVVKLVVTIVFALFIIDMIGRRKAFIVGLSLQLVAHIYLAVYFHGNQTSEVTNKSASNGAIAMIFIYAVGWSVGLCTVPYIYGSEVFPTRVRNVAYASTMGYHWFLQFAVVRALPPMFISFDNWGVYVFFALVCFSGLILLGVWAPETKRVQIEHMDQLFAGQWYKGWKARPIDTVNLLAEEKAYHRDSDPIQVEKTQSTSYA